MFFLGGGPANANDDDDVFAPAAAPAISSSGKQPPSILTNSARRVSNPNDKGKTHKKISIQEPKNKIELGDFQNMMSRFETLLCSSLTDNI